MAFDFVKKIFSFGRKAEEAPESGAADATPSPQAGPLAEVGPAQPRQIPETPETPHRPSLDDTPPDHPRPVPPAPEVVPEPPVPVPEPEPARPPEPTPEPARPPEPSREPAKPPVEVPPAPEPSLPEPPQPAVPPLEVPPPAQPERPSQPETPVEPAPPPPEVPTERPPLEVPEPPEPQQPASAPLEVPPREPPGASAEPRVAKREETAPSPAPAAPDSKPSKPKVTVARTVETKQETAPVAPAPAQRVPWLQRLRHGLSRSSRELTSSISGVFTKRRLDEDTLQDLEDVLIRADLGMETAIRVTSALSAGRFGRDISDSEVRAVMAEEMTKVLAPVALPLELDLSHKPHVILVVGVNGTGKTTTIGKLAAKLREGGLSVMLAAGDTFRAAAIEQLKIWGERTGSPVVSSKLGADAAGLAFDAFEKAKAAGSDVLIIDTAGRLQNKAELMAELEKIVRVLSKHDAEAPHTVLQTVDATTGQNALNQVEIFRNVAGVNGLVMTKLDGTARGGILVAIAAKHKLPVYFIGVGEQVDDLEPFSAGDFAKAIAGVE